MPQFRQTPLSLANSVAAGVVPIVILVFEVAAAFFFAFIAFLRMERAGGSWGLHRLRASSVLLHFLAHPRISPTISLSRQLTGRQGFSPIAHVET